MFGRGFDSLRLHRDWPQRAAKKHKKALNFSHLAKFGAFLWHLIYALGGALAVCGPTRFLSYCAIAETQIAAKCFYENANDSICNAAARRRAFRALWVSLSRLSFVFFVSAFAFRRF